MAYPPHYLTQFGGNFGTSNPEVWSCGIRIARSGGLGLEDFDPDDGYLVDIAVPALAAWFARATSKISSLCKLTYVKCNEIDGNGEYADQTATNEYYWAVPVAGGGASQLLPMQCSVVLSWETNEASRGIASKGRIYSPAPAVSVSSTGLFPAAEALGMAQSASTLLNSLDDTVGLGQIRPCIVSRGRETAPGVYGAGAARQIDSVRVDNRVDVQRRRANQLVAVSSTAAVSY